MCLRKLGRKGRRNWFKEEKYLFSSILCFFIKFFPLGAIELFRGKTMKIAPVFFG